MRLGNDIIWSYQDRYNPKPSVLTITTDIWYRKDADGIIEARQGFRVWGDKCPSMSQSKNPFDDKYYDNYHSGRAIDEEKALNVLKREYDNLAKML